MHCICRKSIDAVESDRCWIEGDDCGVWHHLNCVGLTKEAAHLLTIDEKEWCCPSCTSTRAEARPVRKRKAVEGFTYDRFGENGTEKRKRQN